MEFGQPHRFVATEAAGEVSGLLARPPDARALYVLAHGAGAGMSHTFMTALARRLADRQVATFRFQFPYTEAGRRRPDHRNTLVPTVRAAVACAHALAPDLPMVAGGKSMGGRMTSQAAAETPLPGVRGLAFVGFPLHPPDKPGIARAAHLADVTVPMLFVQGTRDKLAQLPLLAPVCEALGPLATVRVIEGADHGFAVLKRSGRTDAEVLDELADEVRAFCDALAR